MRQLTTEQFIQKAIKIHGEKYNYSKVIYTTSQSPVIIVCPIHGEFKQSPNNHLNSKGCKKCATEQRSKKYKSNTNEFIQKAIKIHGKKYDYKYVKYGKNNNVHIKIFCNTCQNFFNCTPHNHLRGRGCPTCANENRKLTQDDFIKKSKKIHNNFYDYSLVRYIQSTIPIIIICPKHGEFEQRAYSHLMGKGCPTCANENRKLTQDDFIKKSKKIHNNFYDYSLTKYTLYENHVTIICPQHGKFEQRAWHHLRGHGCRKCKQSGPEKIIEQYLKESNLKYIYQYKFDDCRGIKRPLPFDFYLPDYNISIEYDGEQHFSPIFNMNESDMKKRIKNDLIKTKYCQNEGIKLIRINFKEQDNIIEILKKEIC